SDDAKIRCCGGRGRITSRALARYSKCSAVRGREKRARWPRLALDQPCNPPPVEAVRLVDAQRPCARSERVQRFTHALDGVGTLLVTEPSADSPGARTCT